MSKPTQAKPKKVMEHYLQTPDGYKIPMKFVKLAVYTANSQDTFAGDTLEVELVDGRKKTFIYK